MYLIFGLGNPGRRYAHSRHNMGFEAVDIIAKEHEIRIKESKFAAFAGEGFIGSEKIVLVKPTTYMNLSGEAVRDFVRWHKMPSENFAARLIVIYDDIDLPVGKIRIRERGSAGGHNGMKSILYHLETEDFIRIRVGVGGKPKGGNLSAHVLGKVDKEEEATMVHGIIAAAAAVEDIVRHGINFAMNKYNQVPKEKKEKRRKNIMFRNPKDVHGPLASYSHQAEVGPGAKWLVMSAQIGMDKDGHVPDDILDQINLAFDNIQHNLKAASMDINNLVKLVFYFTGTHDIEQRRNLIKQRLGEHQPCMTVIYAAGLADPALKVEIEAWACK